MPPLVSNAPATPLTPDEHAEVIIRALSDFNLTPRQLAWHYTQMAFKTYNRNVSATARRLKLHRRTLQRVVQKVHHQAMP